MDIRKTTIENLEEFKLCLISRATGGSIDAERYKALRKNILGNPQINELVPSFIKTCHSPDEFWSFIKSESPSYQGRREIIRNAINPIIEKLEKDESTLDEHFSVGDKIGGGGFGLVYKLRHKYLEMDFAIKVFNPFMDNGDPKYLDRFYREARILFQLNHPNIVKVYDVGLLNGKPFIRMEYIDGKNLNTSVIEDGIKPPEIAVHIIIGIAEGLSYAHKVGKGIIHRDLKPSNVMVSNSGTIKVVDYGQGIFVEDDIVSRITKSNEQAVGGLFTAPELNSNPKMVDIRTDIYSIGAIWYYLLCGRPPAGTNVLEYLEKTIPDLSEGYKTIILKCLNDIDNRYATIEELLLAISQLKEKTA